jgi:DNA gyrase subunit A
MGIINVKVTPKSGEVIAVKQVDEGDGLVLITQDGMILRTQVAGVRRVSRGAVGVKMMELDEADRLIAAAPVAEREDEGDEVPPPPSDGGETPPPETIH